jgi:hypothetical protein
LRTPGLSIESDLDTGVVRSTYRRRRPLYTVGITSSRERHQRIEVFEMSDENKVTERVTFSRGYDVCIMAIDGTWRRDCQLNAISDNDAMLTVEGSIQGLNLKEFFLLLSSTGLAYRRCELVRVNGAEMDIQFIKGKNKKKRGSASSNQEVAAT